MQGRLIGLCGVLCLWTACAGPMQEAPAHAVDVSPAAPAPRSPMLELAALIPAGALRCVVSRSAPLSPEQRALMLLVSQTETLPWSVPVPVLGYARARVSTAAGYRTLSWLRFEAQAGGTERIRAALESASPARIRWEGDGKPCANPADCPSLRGHFLDPFTVMLSKGVGPTPLGSGDNICAGLLREFPEALEVSSWRHDSAFSLDLGLLRTDQILWGHAAFVTKLRRRAYSSDRRQVDAYREALFGADDLPLIASVPVEPYREVRGLSILDRADVSWEDLRLLLEDERRQREARGLRSVVTRVPSDDLEALRDQAYWLLNGLEQKGLAERREAARLLSRWLLRARQSYPRDQTLARAQYRVFLRELSDPQSALAVTHQMLELAAGGEPQWQLNRRRALAHLGAAELKPALAEAHALGPADAAAMAAEVAGKVSRGLSFERAEWAWLSARELAAREKGVPARNDVSVELPLRQLPAVLAHLATRTPALRASYGIHLLARGVFAVDPRGEGLSSPPDAWVAQSVGGGGVALVGAASSEGTAQLETLGAYLAKALADGPFSLLVGLRPLAGGRGQGVRLRFEGHVAAGTFHVARMNARAARLDWPRIARLLVEPLVGMPTNLRDPPPLRVPAASVEEAVELVTWAEAVQGVHCKHVERWVVCRGPRGVPDATVRALLRMNDRALADQSALLWGEAQP